MTIEESLQQIITTLNENSGAVIAFATIALVCITGYYAFQTRQTTKAIKKSSELSIRPHLKGSVNVLGISSVVMHISNVGTGPANNVKLEYWRDTESDLKRKWGRPFLMPNDGDDIFIQDRNGKTVVKMDYFEKNNYVIILKGEYEDTLGNKHKMDDSIDVTEFVKSLSGVLYKEESLEKIADSLKSIESHLSRA